MDSLATIVKIAAASDVWILYKNVCLNTMDLVKQTWDLHSTLWNSEIVILISLILIQCKKVGVIKHALETQTAYLFLPAGVD